MTGLLELAGVTKSFVLPTGERLDILRGLDLTVGAGEVTAIVGRSGSGKTTLLNLLGLLDTPTSGTLRCNGLDIARMGDAKRSRLRGEFLGFIFQQFHLLDRRTAVENVAEPLLFGTRRDVGRRKTRAHALLDQVGLSDRAHSMPHLLSGGEQQRVAIARALVRSPRVVLADEPTGALDEATGERVLDLLFDLARAEGVALVVVTHDPAVADRADRVLTLAGGRLHDGAAERPVVIGDVIAAWLDVRTKPLRTLAAIAGMVAAVVAVVLVDAAGVLSREANDTYLARQYGLSVTASIFSESGQSAAAQAALLEATLRDNGIVALSPDVNLPATVTYGGTVVFHGVRWFSPEYNNIRIVNLVAGAWPSDTANSDVLHVVLNEGWAQEALGLTDKQAIGQVLGYSTGLTASFDVKSTPVKPMIVDAVVSTATNAFASGSSPVAVVTALSHPDLLGNVTAMSWVARVHPRDYGFLQELVASVTDEQGRPVYRTARADEGDQLAPVLSQQSVTARVVTIVALTIGGLGILGVGIASVRERAKDFGLRRALGASKLRIFAGVIVQTLMEVLLAAVIAIPLAAILLELFARDMVLESLPLPPSTSLPLGSAMQGLAGALIVGLVAGLVPAISAARASVVQALRG